MLLKITVESAEPAPTGGASFKFEPIATAGPIDDILGVGPFSLVILHSNDTSGTSTGDLTRCDTPDACSATFAVTETQVTREIGTTVECQF